MPHPGRLGADDGPADDPLHGQGRRRQDQRRRGHRAALCRGRAAHRRALDRPGPQPLGLARGRARRRPDARRRPPLGPGGPGAARDGAQLGRGAELALGPARRPRRDEHRRRGADRPAGDGRALLACCRSSATTSPATTTWSSSTAPRPGRRCGCSSFPDIARWWLEKVLPVGAAAGQRRAADRAHDPRRAAAERGRVRRGPAPRPQPDRDERDPPRSRARLDPAGHEPRPDGRSRRPSARSPTSTSTAT